MLVPSWWEVLEQIEQIPQEIIDACAEIIRTILQKTDVRRLSFIDVPSSIPHFPKHLKGIKVEDGDRNELFFPLLCSGILNVCPAVIKWWIVYSIAINPALVDEVLSYEQIIADIALAELLFWDTWDRLLNFIWGKVWVELNNAKVFEAGTYSIFDFELWKITKVPKSKVVEWLITSLQNLHGGEFVNIWFLNRYALVWEDFGKRILTCTALFLERYDNKQGEALYISQYLRTEKLIQDRNPETLRKKWEREYFNFIVTLRNIQTVFQKHSDIVAKTVHKATGECY